MLITQCLCGSTSFKNLTRHRIACAQCQDCGIIHQRIDTTPADLARWYEETYMDQVYTHDQAQDAAAARARLKAYGGKLTGRVLDIGCGNGAFISAAKEAGIDAVGQDLNRKGDGPVYRQPLEEIAFPTEHFHTVTAHDVIEHAPDPVALLRECRRVTAKDGWFICDFPDFRERRHWKATEHLWMLNREQAVEALAQAGLRTVYWTVPVPGKFTFYCRPEHPPRPSVLVPPGIGDSYWSMVKLPALLKQWGAEIADVWVVDDGSGRKRSLEWLRRLPFVHARGYREMEFQNPVFQEAYMQEKRWLFPNVCGCDHFLSFNGRMRFGADIDSLVEGGDWMPRMFISLKEREQMRRYQDRPYIVGFFADHGMYRHWLEEMPETQIAGMLAAIAEDAGAEIRFMGAKWDEDGIHGRLMREINRISDTGKLAEDYSGKTTISDMFALIQGSQGVIGWPAGNTIMATVLKTPTLLFWNRYFDRRFWANACPPQSRGKWYQHCGTHEHRGDLVEWFCEVVR